MAQDQQDDTRRSRLVVVPLLLFVALSSAFFWHARGDDLASSFVGCRVLATGHDSSLYSYDPVNFAGIADTDAVWPRLALEGGYHGWLHPYVQTPLWAWALRPLCTSLQWPAFEHLFLVLGLCSLAGIVVLTARYWAPRLYTGTALASTLMLLALCEPFLFAMVLVQTHALLLLLTVAGLVLAQRGRSAIAGLLVACAAAVKITPAVLLLYWIAGRRWRAAISFVGWSAILFSVTRLIATASLSHAFLASMHRVSHVLLVAENNQSLAAWYMGHYFPADEIFDVNAFPLPAMLQRISTVLMLGSALLGGWMDWKTHAATPSVSCHKSIPPFGAALTLVGMTIFAPIAWSHYFIILVVPLMLLAELAFTPRSTLQKTLLWLVIALSGALLFRPLAPDVIRMDLADAAVLHGEFYAGILCLLACLAAWRLSTESS